jgi:hypothetical protein
MQGVVGEAASVLRLAVRCIYAISGLICLGALAFAWYRYHQIHTLTPLDALVLKSATESYTETVDSRDSQGFSEKSKFTGYLPVVWVRYEFNGKTYSVEAWHDTGSSFRWFQERITRRWKSGSHIRVHLDPAKPDKPLPDLGLNLHTFQMSMALAIISLFFAGVGYGVGRLGTFAMRYFDYRP